MSKITYARAALNGPLRHFIGGYQYVNLNHLLKLPDADFYADRILSIAETVDNMPLPYETDGQGDKILVYLHYFKGGCDWYITERDSSEEQIKSFGRADLGYGPELGYISIQELIENGAALDLHWRPKPLHDCG
jgi:hypothetical protein